MSLICRISTFRNRTDGQTDRHGDHFTVAVQGEYAGVDRGLRAVQSKLAIKRVLVTTSL